MSDLAPRFAFVLQHARVIDAATRRYCSGTLLSFEDYRSELVLDLVETFERWNPERGAASTWIYMRARHVCRGLVRQSVRNTGAPLLDTEILPDSAFASENRIEARTEVALILDRAESDDRVAALSYLREWSASRVRERLGCSTVQRTQRLRALVGEG
jgi:RNA polymerase sigma factor (sigma-70 family)